MHAADVRNGPRVSGAQAIVRDCVIVGSIVFLASLFGIMTRPVGFLASFWPANALLLGVFIRYPHLASPAGWMAAAIGYLAADLLTGNELLNTSWLTLANLVGVGAGVMAARFMTPEERALQHGKSMLRIFSVCLVSALAAALMGGWVAHLLFERDFVVGAAFWFTTEFVNAAIIVPIVIAMPAVALWPSLFSMKPSVRALLPFVCTLLLAMLGKAIGGPALVALPLPALIWCALTYSLFTTALITLVVCSTQMIIVAIGAVPSVAGADVWSSSVSLRLSVACAALCPLTVAAVNTARTRLIARLDRSANYDSLTGALSRAAFMRRAAELIDLQMAKTQPMTLLMVDIDHFKAINDQHGHAVGDVALSSFGALVRDEIRNCDLFGRIGGEEFAIVLPDAKRDEALAIAERLRAKVAEQNIKIADSDQVPFTVSIGVASKPSHLHQMLREADMALYHAKENGRNRIMDATLLRLPERRGGSPGQATVLA